jgi:fermentation-respiration switch protein FrsA (DUF1100 family)
MYTIINNTKSFLCDEYCLCSGWIISIVLWLLTLILWCLTLVLFLVWYSQGLLLYMPTFAGRKGLNRSNEYNSRGYRSPAEHNLPYEDVYITCRDNTVIHAWLIKQPVERFSSAPTLIFFHGNAGNIGFRLPNAKSLYYSCDCNILMVEYRGFGCSAGKPTEFGLALDAEASLNWVKQQSNLNQHKVFIFGRSLGGAVALWLTHHYQANIAGCIVENTFTSVADMVFALMEKMGLKLDKFSMSRSVIERFLSVFMTSHWRSVDLIGKITTPMMFISGQLDELVPREQMKNLYDLAGSSSEEKLFYPVYNGYHNDTFVRAGGEYWIKFNQFMKKHSESREQPNEQ